MSATAKNLQAIQNALDQHADRCKARALEIRLAPFEVDRLGFDEFAGIPIAADPDMQTGRVRVICEAMTPEGQHVEQEEAVPA